MNSTTASTTVERRNVWKRAEELVRELKLVDGVYHLMFLVGLGVMEDSDSNFLLYWEKPRGKHYSLKKPSHFLAVSVKHNSHDIVDLSIVLMPDKAEVYDDRNELHVVKKEDTNTYGAIRIPKNTFNPIHVFNMISLGAAGIQLQPITKLANMCEKQKKIPLNKLVKELLRMYGRTKCDKVFKIYVPLSCKHIKGVLIEGEFYADTRDGIAEDSTWFSFNGIRIEDVSRGPYRISATFEQEFPEVLAVIGSNPTIEEFNQALEQTIAILRVVGKRAMTTLHTLYTIKKIV